jgi:hypothetical protein
MSNFVPFLSVSSSAHVTFEANVSALRGMGPRLLKTIPPGALTRVTGTSCLM